MKAPKTSAVSKLLNRFDQELRNILLNDLTTVRTHNLINAINQQMPRSLKAA